MHELLQRTVDLPEIRLAPGEAVMKEGEAGASLWILVSGALQIGKPARSSAAGRPTAHRAAPAN
jgi:CRP-like cAMP-binding protein